MHEKPWLPAFLADREQAGGPAGGDLPVQAGGRPERRHGPSAQLGDVRRQLRPDRDGDGRQVEGLIHGEPGGGQDAGDLLVGSCPVGDMLGAGIGVPGHEQLRILIDRFPVHRHAQQQVRRPRHLGQAGQQVLEQHIIGGQRHGLGQGGLQPGPGGQPPAAVGPAELAADRLAEPGGHVRVAGGAAGQQRVEVFQRPRVAAGQPPHLLQLALIQPVQGGQ